MATTQRHISTYDPDPYTDDDGLRRYHNTGGDYVVIQNLKAGNVFSISRDVWQIRLGEDLKNIPAEWRSYKDVMVIS
jgi:hypothetical protein